ncbi:MAG: AsmA family protein [Bacteroidaceae bacterium]|nr:AsmA family protein [Bacteroidaceae bacterium]
MKKVVKISAAVIGIFIALLLVLPFVFKDKIIGIVKEEANKMLNAKLEFEDLDISFFSHFPKASIELENLSLSGTDDFEGDTLVSAKEIAVAVDISSLFNDKGFEISYIDLKKPSIKAVKLKDGKVNWDIMKPTDASDEIKEDEERSSSFSMKLNNVTIQDGTIAYYDDSTSMSFYTDKLNLKLKGDMSAKQSNLACNMQTRNIYFVMGRVPYLKNAEFKMAMNVNADFENQKFTFNENQLQLNAIQLNVDGWIAMLQDGMDMDIKVNSPKIEFKDVLSLIPAIYQNNFNALQTSGKLAFNASAKGKMQGDNVPQFNASLDVKDARFNYDNMPKTVEQIAISANVNNPGGSLDKTVVNVSNLSFSMAGNPFKATLYASTPISDLNFKATADGKLDLNAVKEVYPLGDSTDLNGTITANLKFAGKMSDIEKERYENVQGEGTFAIDQMKFKTTDFLILSIEKAQASVNPKSLSLSEFNLKIGASDLHAKGEISNYLPYVLRNETLHGKLDITSNLLDINELMGETETAETTESDTTVISAIEVPKNLNLALTANVKKILFQKMVIENLTGNLTVANGTVQMNPLNMNLFGGTISANGSYSTTKSAENPEVKFALNIKQASFERTFNELDMIQQLVPLFAKTGGNYSVNFDMNTTLDKSMSPDLKTLMAKGLLESANINIQNIEVFDQLASLLKNDKLKNINAKDIKIPFTIEDGLIKTNPFDLSVGNISMNLSGTTSLSQEIDYNAKIKLPENSLGDYVKNVTAHIGGTFTSPKISLNTKDMIQDAIKQNITDKLFGNKNDSTSVTSDISAKIEKLRADAETAGQKLITAAEKEGNKLVEKASNPVAKIAAKKGAEALVKKAKEQAEKLKTDAEAKIKELEQGNTSETK